MVGVSCLGLLCGLYCRSTERKQAHHLVKLTHGIIRGRSIRGGVFVGGVSRRGTENIFKNPGNGYPWGSYSGKGGLGRGVSGSLPCLCPAEA